MKFFFAGLVLMGSLCSFSETLKAISGTVSLAKGLEKEVKPLQGTLFIFAKNAGQASANGSPPLAVLRIPDPKFPLTFSLSAENVMMAGTVFEGPFAVYARYSPSGDALDKSGPQGEARSKKQIKLGEKNISIELNKK